MAGIQASTGLISGVPITDTVDQLIAVSAQPRDRLTVANNDLQAKQTAIGALSALVIGTQLTTDPMGKATFFSQTKVSSSSSAITATATGTPKVGKYQFVPVQLAQTQQYTSSLLASSDQLVGAGTLDVYAGGFLDNSVALDELNGGTGVSRGIIKVTDRSGGSAQVDLRYAFSAADVVKAINSASGINVTAKVSGDKFVLTDNSTGSGTLSVSEVGGGVTARDLGLAGLSTTSSSITGTDVLTLTRSTSLRSLLDGRGVQLGGTNASLAINLQDGSTVNVTTGLKSNTASVGQLIDAINTAGGGKLLASINSSGDGLQLQDLTSGGNTLSVTSPSGNLAQALGWDQAPSGNTLSGAKLQSGLSDVLLTSLNGGAGIKQLGDLTLTDRSGASATVNLSSAKTINEVITAINASGIGVSARLNDSKTGLLLSDTTGATTTSLSATSSDGSNSAVKLGLASGSDPTKLDSGSLNRQWINENTLLSGWNQGSSLTYGTFSITDAAGTTKTVTLNSTVHKTVGDVIDAINNSGAAVTARLNEKGDGLLLVDNSGGTGTLTVTDASSGSTAKQLGLAGTAKSLTVGGQAVNGIDGSRRVTITTDDSTTVSDLVTKLNDSGAGAKANLISLGNGGVRVALTSSGNGSAGRLALSSSGLSMNFTETSVAQNALISVGGTSNSAGLLLSSSTDTFTNAMDGVSLTLTSASTTPVSVEVKSNSDTTVKQVQSMVDQVNKVLDKLKELTSFDSSTYKTGLLFGSVEALRTSTSISQLFGSRLTGTGSIRSMAELGVSFNDQGKLALDQTKLKAAIDRDPAAVQEFFTKDTTGFSARAKAVVDSLTGTKSGLLLKRNDSLQATIELNSNRIANWNIKLDRERTRLLTQFYNMESAIAKQKSSLSSITSLTSSSTTTA
ncbi:MAG: flagellar filament capping protein FliD [Pirellulales bacterium]